MYSISHSSSHGPQPTFMSSTPRYIAHAHLLITHRGEWTLTTHASGRGYYRHGMAYYHLTYELYSFTNTEPVNPRTGNPRTRGPKVYSQFRAVKQWKTEMQLRQGTCVNVLNWMCAAAKVVSLCTYSPHRYVYTQKAFFMPDCTIYFTLSTSFFHSFFPNRE